jgi:subtilase family serine protease
MVPDISWLADPFTGVEIVITGDAQGDQFVGVIGGTSLSCPMFSGLWAIASQRAGHKLGQAAASIYDLDDDAIRDVRTVGSPADVSGAIHDAGGIAPEVPSDLAAPLQNLPDFYSALYNSPFSTRWFVITFGTDSTLAAGNGYDLATGLGTPNPQAFVDSFAPRGHH